jgi:hypothetical protein
VITVLLDEEATKAGDRYVNFLLSLRSVLNASLKMRPDDARAFGSIRDGAYAIAEVFLQTESDLIENALKTVRELAVARAREEVLSDTPATDFVLEDYSDELVLWFRSELRAQIERDVNVLVSKRRELSLAATMGSWGRGRDMMGAYEALLSAGRETVVFYFTDRAGRRYPSQKYYRQLVRHSLLTLAVESYALEVSSLGVETVYVDHPDKNNSYTGKAVTLVGKSNVLSLADIRDEVFHPNSVAFLSTQP